MNFAGNTNIQATAPSVFSFSLHYLGLPWTEKIPWQICFISVLSTHGNGVDELLYGVPEPRNKQTKEMLEGQITVHCKDKECV